MNKSYLRPGHIDEQHKQPLKALARVVARDAFPMDREDSRQSDHPPLWREELREVQRITLATLAFGFAEVLRITGACEQLPAGRTRATA